jgi:hypothetical protein
MRRSLLLTLVLVLVGCGGGPDAGQPLTAQDVVAAFEVAGLEAEDVREMAAEDYGLVPMAEEGLYFLLPSVCEDCGGRAMLFESEEQAERVMTYYEAVAESSPAFSSWAYRRGPLVVQLNGELSEEQAKRYEEVLNSLP